MTLSRARTVALVLLQAFCGVGLLGMEAAAQEEAKPILQKVLGLRIEGFELSAKDREDLFKVVQGRLKTYPTIELVRPPEAELTDLMIDLGCMDIDVDCLTKVGRKRMAHRVFYAQVDAADSGFVLSVRLIDVTKGHAVRDNQVSVTDQAGLREALVGEIIATFGEPPPPKPKDGRIIIETDAGAKIYIDGRLAGSGRISLKKPPGLYVVRVEKQGFENALFRLDLEAGATERKVAELKPIPPPTPVKAAVAPKPVLTKEAVPDPEVSDSTPFYESWWFWTTIGAVVATATTVGVVVGMDGPAPATGDVQISVDPTSVWRDVSLRAGSAP